MCLYGGECLMSGEHWESECYTADMVAESVDEFFGVPWSRRFPGLTVARRVEILPWCTSRRFTEPLSNNSAWFINRERKS